MYTIEPEMYTIEPEMYKIEIRGKYTADVETPSRAAAVLVVGLAKERKDVSLIRVLRGNLSYVLAFEGDKWVEVGKRI
jgi:hypothetical protein